MQRRADSWDVDLRRLRRSSLTAAGQFASAHGSTKRRRTLLAPLELDWYNVFKTRTELDRRWNASLPIGTALEDKENARAWEPQIKRLEGHKDR